MLLGEQIYSGFTWVLRGAYFPSLKRNRIKSIFSTVGILIESNFEMKKIIPFMFLFFAGFVISIASINYYKKNPSKKITSIDCEIPEKVKLSVKDVVNLDILNINHPQRRAFNRVVGFNHNRKTYRRPIKYYIHNKTGFTKLKILSLPENYTYAMSEDSLRFIVDTFKRIDSYIDLDFEYVKT